MQKGNETGGGGEGGWEGKTVIYLVLRLDLNISSIKI